MKVGGSVGKVINTLSQAQHFKKTEFGLTWLLTMTKKKDLEHGLVIQDVLHIDVLNNYMHKLQLNHRNLMYT